MSDNWVYFYRKGIVAEPVPLESDYQKVLSEGTVLVIYDKQKFSGLKENFSSRLVEGKDYLQLNPNGCSPQLDRFVLKVWRGDWAQ